MAQDPDLCSLLWVQIALCTLYLIHYSIIIIIITFELSGFDMK